MARLALVTGANRGLGFETARQLAQKGYRVILSGRREAEVERAVETLRAEGLAEVVPAILDVSTDAGVAAGLERLRSQHGTPLVLVNNAGAILESGHSGTLEVPAETVAKALHVNTLGAYRLIQACLPAMNEARFGRVVSVSSGMGALTDMDGGWPAYRISKTALHAVTRVFHNEAGDNVKVNVVCPGWVRTDMGGSSATRSIPEGVAGIVWAATLPDDGPSGGFFRDGEPIAW